MWERACSRRGHNTPHQGRLTHRFREQARSHRVSGPHSKRATRRRQHCPAESTQQKAPLFSRRRGFSLQRPTLKARTSAATRSAL
ncbi:hypothetical protein CGA21_13185 [Pseudomonas sp. PSB11]|nr:hypothetical protein [Pseudomonas sp. PSB11]